MRLSLLLSLVPLVLSYASKTHYMLGDIADKFFETHEPEIYSKIKYQLKGNTIAKVSSWADQIKRKQQWSKKLHYIDILECNKQNYTKEIVDKYCDKKCITQAIIDFSNLLKTSQIGYKKVSKLYTSIPDEDLLKFLIHFIQDFNQPMHLLGYDRGGNTKKIIVNHKGRNRTTNMHFLWDSLIPEYYLKNQINFETKFYLKNSLEFETKFYLENSLEFGDNVVDEVVYDILNKNMQISCNIYPEEDYIVFEEYYKKEYVSELFNNYLYMINHIMLFIYA